MRGERERERENLPETSPKREREGFVRGGEVFFFIDFKRGMRG